MTRTIRIQASPHATPGKVTALDQNRIVWFGAIKDLGKAGAFSTICCHDADEQSLVAAARRNNIGVAA